MMPQDSLVQDALKSIELNKAFQLLQKYKINDNYDVEIDEHDENEGESVIENKALESLDSANAQLMDSVSASLFVLPSGSASYLDRKQNGLNCEARKDLIKTVALVGTCANHYLKLWSTHVDFTTKGSQNNSQRFCTPPFMWHTGGDGPVFGSHLSIKRKVSQKSRVGPQPPDQEINLGKMDSLNCNNNKHKMLHLRAVCHYGESITDEWYFIGLLFHLSQTLSSEFPTLLLPIEIWDSADGQVLLIEGAEYIPQWCTPKLCRHRLWLVNGELYLIKPDPSFQKSLSNIQAMKILLKHFRSKNEQEENDLYKYNIVDSAPHEIKQMILDKFRCTSLPSQVNARSLNPIPTLSLRNYLHFAPCVLPLRLASMVRLRPDLIHCAVQVFYNLVDQYAQEQEATQNRRDVDNARTQQSFLPVGFRIPYQDLVTAVVPFSKLRYAMLRTREELKMPFEFRTAEAGRLRRILLQKQSSQDQNIEEHYLGHALDNGVRLTLAFEWFMHMEDWKEEYKKSKNSQNSTLKQLGIIERRAIYWARLDQLLGGNGQWIHESWSCGPAHVTSSENDIKPLLDCPVFDHEIQSQICPRSKPQQSLWQQLAAVHKKAESSSYYSVVAYPIPLEDNVDNEKWMTFQSITHLESHLETLSRMGVKNGKQVLYSDEATELACEEDIPTNWSDILNDCTARQVEAAACHDVSFEPEELINIIAGHTGDTGNISEKKTIEDSAVLGKDQDSQDKLPLDNKNLAPYQYESIKDVMVSCTIIWSATMFYFRQTQIFCF